MSIKIIVNRQELKDKLLKESEYIHDLEYIDSDKANTLMHIYMNPDMIEVNQKEDERGEATSAYERISVIARMKDKTATGLTRDDLLDQNEDE